MQAQTTVTFTEQQASWMRSQIDTGRYADDGELLRDLVRREQERTTELETLRAALLAGEASGEPRAFDVAAFKQRMRLANG